MEGETVNLSTSSPQQPNTEKLTWITADYTTPALSGDTTVSSPNTWHVYMEAIFVSVICFIGLVGNTSVVSTLFRNTRFAKHNIFLILGLSISDLLTCIIRGPCLVYILLHTASDRGEMVCGLWVASTIFVAVALVTNAIIAIERTMIVHCFQSYLKCFTRKSTLALSVSVWLFIGTCFACIYVGLQSKWRFFEDFKSCAMVTIVDEKMTVIAKLVEVLVSVVFGFVPIVVIIVCYISIVAKVCKSGLLAKGRLEERAIYSRVTFVSLARVLVVVGCMTPFLFFVTSGAFNIIVFHLNVRYFDYILLLQSVISPFISMHDSYLKEKVSPLTLQKPKIDGNAPSTAPKISSANMKTCN